jgi:LmbE family N-acetylglucosaminyl deacetylase
LPEAILTLFEWSKTVALAIPTTLWSSGFALARRIRSLTGMNPIQPWTSTGHERVLVIAPHPDDEAVGCAGTLLRHQQVGDQIWLVHVTDGRRSRALGLAPTAMARQRAAEAKIAADRLQLNHMSWLGLPEGDWSVEQLAVQLGPIFSDFAPTLVYAPSRIDFHPEHQQVAHTLAGLFPIHDERPVRIYQVQLPLTGQLTNLVVDVSAYQADIETIFAAYLSQSYSIQRTWRSRRYAARYYGFETLAEEFWQVPAYIYRSLHEAEPANWATGVFRSLRFYPFTDPLAYWQGSNARQDIAHLARQATYRSPDIANP